MDSDFFPPEQQPLFFSAHSSLPAFLQHSSPLAHSSVLLQASVFSTLAALMAFTFSPSEQVFSPWQAALASLQAEAHSL